MEGKRVEAESIRAHRPSSDPDAHVTADQSDRDAREARPPKPRPQTLAGKLRALADRAKALAVRLEVENLELMPGANLAAHEYLGKLLRRADELAADVGKLSAFASVLSE